jgi:hypothetical protein
MAVMTWRRERLELFPKDALIVFLLLAEGPGRLGWFGQSFR